MASDFRGTEPELASRLARLRDVLCRERNDGEGFALHLAAESSSFIRLNGGRVRQPGSVEQCVATLRWFRGEQRMAECQLDLGGDDDEPRLAQAIARMRDVLEVVPEDPYVRRAVPRETALQASAPRAPDLEPAGIVDAALEAAAAHGRDQGRSTPADLVGLIASGPIERGFCSDRGELHTFATWSTCFDFSVVHEADKAAKGQVAATCGPGQPGLSVEDVAKAVRTVADQAELLARPPRTIEPGRYRAYLTPSAVHELFFLLGELSFSAAALATGKSALQRLYEGKESLHPSVSVVDDVGGSAPRFDAEGFVRPARIELVSDGAAGSRLTSARSAAEFGLDDNGASAGEQPVCIDMAGGDLDEHGVLEQLERGLFISDLWYSNWSDRERGKLTAMTRFASGWVEGGKVVAPIRPARLDDSLFRMLGTQLLGLTRERRRLANTDTYDSRHLGDMLLPGALLGEVEVTL